VTAQGGGPSRPRSERDVLEAVAGALRARGYRTYLDPDGSDYFDLAARRDQEVGLVEGKLGTAGTVLAQALRRRPWADWVAVALGSGRSARRLVERTAGHRASLVGVWSVEQGRPRELRAAGATHPEGAADPFAASRDLFRQHLVDLDRGVLARGVRWSSVPSAVRRASAGRGFAEWRLDEIDGGRS